MREVIRNFFIAVLLGFFMVASAQLPPLVIADKYRIQLEQRLGVELTALNGTGYKGDCSYRD